MSELDSRAGVTDPLGKCICRVETAVPEPVKADMTVHWRLLGFGSEAEWVRDLIVKELYGSFARMQMLAQRAVRSYPGNPRGTEGAG